ncbi:T9SS C-terminal target domain-containing protein [Lacihabitans sp. LS3-19]|uniref:MopE-related protein n=1 Tax=Lacihabitans sp. LS3-19 TaxID=2487335 RepID=UPI0020CE5A9C|nr:MopE-related protein [Lacihabitans sp. LS3-19]MCP9770357.1 T9SS C-terminal target domain-containing protein [Lacihabitans sp. LS3-19]
MSKTLRSTFILFLIIYSNFTSAQVSKLLKDINPGPGSSLVNGYQTYCSFNGSLIFAAKNEEYGHEVWIYKNNIVSLLKDINLGPNGSKADFFFDLNGKLIFVAKTEAAGFELWTSDGTTEGTQILGDFNPGEKNGVFGDNGTSLDRFLVFNNKLYFTGIEGNNYRLWSTDGTKEGTGPLKNMSNSHSFPENLTVFKDEIYFSSTFNGIFKIEKDTENVIKIIDMSTVYNILATDDLLYAIDYSELWISKGTSASSKKIITIESPTVNWGGNRLVALGNFVLFPNSTSASGPELWKTDGTTEGTMLVKDVWPGNNGYAPQNYTVFQNKIFYKGENGSNGIELFQSDGTAAGTKMVLDLNNSFSSSFYLPSTIISDTKRLYFNAAAFFYDNLYISDGTAIGTRKVKVTNDLFTDDQPTNFFLFDNKLVVFVKDENLGYEPYIIDFEQTLDDPDKDGYVGDNDCDESNPLVNKGAFEIPYNGIDDDCNPLTPDDDLDQDGYKKAEDCDDRNAKVNPRQVEIPYNGLDDDCNPATPDDDIDGDGYYAFEDCNDNDKNINPEAKEIPNNNIDEDCDGTAEQILSLGQESEVLVLAFPNPSTGVLSLENIDIETLRVYDANGKSVVFKIENGKLRLMNVPNGLYIITGKTLSDQISFSRKIQVVGK